MADPAEGTNQSSANDRPLPYGPNGSPGIGNSPIIRRPVILGDLTLASPTTQTTVGSAGSASALPATPTGYLTVNLGNGSVVIPYYAVS